MAAKANYSKKPENKKKVTEKKEVVKMEAKPVETKQETASAETSAAKTTKEEAKKETKSGAKRGPKPGAKRGPKPGAKRGPKPASERTIEMTVQFGEKEVTYTDMVNRIKAMWKEQGKREVSMKSLELYVKPEESKVYYVINSQDKKPVIGEIDY